MDSAPQNQSIMNREIKRRFLILLMLVGTLSHICAYDNRHDIFKIDDIYYRHLSKAKKTVAVTYAWWEESYTMPELTIPATIKLNDGTECRVIAIDYQGLSWNHNLAHVILPEGIETIGSLAFEYSGIKTVNFPASLKKIGKNIFHKCPNDVTITVNGGNEYFKFENGVLYRMKNKRVCSIIYVFRNLDKKEFIVPEGIDTISDGAFEESEISSIKLPSGIIIIGQGTFRKSKLESIDIPSSVTKIGARAFEGCESIKTITIGESVKAIGEDAFNQTEGTITEITVNATVPPAVTPYEEPAEDNDDFLDESEGTPAPSKIRNENMYQSGESETEKINIFSENTYSNAKLIVPQGTKYAYASAPGWNRFANIEESSSTSIDLEKKNGLKIATLPGTLILSSPEAVSVEIFGTNGMAVYNGMIKSEVSLTLAPGIYLLRTGTSSQKILIR